MVPPGLGCDPNDIHKSAMSVEMLHFQDDLPLLCGVFSKYTCGTCLTQTKCGRPAIPKHVTM